LKLRPVVGISMQSSNCFLYEVKDGGNFGKEKVLSNFLVVMG
jgi:hypothetical protein